MLHIFLNTFPMTLFVGTGMVILALPGLRGKTHATQQIPRSRRFCGYAKGERLMLVDPDGTVSPGAGEPRSRTHFRHPRTYGRVPKR